MVTEIKLAEATKIEQGKKYIAVFELSDLVSDADLAHIRSSVIATFSKYGADVEPVIIFGGSMKILEVEEGSKSDE